MYDTPSLSSLWTRHAKIKGIYEAVWRKLNQDVRCVFHKGNEWHKLKSDLKAVKGDVQQNTKRVCTFCPFRTGRFDLFKYRGSWHPLSVVYHIIGVEPHAVLTNAHVTFIGLNVCHANKQVEHFASKRVRLPLNELLHCMQPRLTSLDGFRSQSRDQVLKCLATFVTKHKPHLQWEGFFSDNIPACVLHPLIKLISFFASPDGVAYIWTGLCRALVIWASNHSHLTIRNRGDMISGQKR